MKEIFKDIRDYEGLYQISNLGKVKSLDKYVQARFCKRLFKGRLLKPFLINGYYRVMLSKKSITKCFFIHRLVAEIFIPNPLNKPFINHLDFNKKNNHVLNLEWVTAKENTQHSFKAGRLKCGNHKSKLTELKKELQ